MTHFCHKCMQYKHEHSFTIWFKDKRKARYCDSCHDDINVKRIISNQKDELEAKKENCGNGFAQSQVGYSKTSKGQAIRDTRRKIEELQEINKINHDHDIEL